MTNSKAKGKRIEREAAEALVRMGFLRAKRGWADGYDLVPASVPGVHIEVKGVERLNIWAAMEQSIRTAADTVAPVVLHKRNRSGWLLTLRLDDLAAFVEAVANEWQRCEEEA